MMSEVIGLIAEIDEKRILSTDLLGDAIESALSETGGTKDIGLYRTPDHIRQMIVALVDPDFADVIFDPACGTGGFLFDAFQYVLEKVTRENEWPGIKAHPELQAFFQQYFAKTPADMPTMDVVNPFYRAGISGIEYLGMIRKMAAINMYIRGLNPQNIEQGDALKMFNPVVDGNSKSVVIANPPFGAERDQPAYPNIWEEHSKETETTILFVKLMFELLNKGGRCAVVVSEGLLTWDQNSAKALRKLLLEDAKLRAVISLPQGVFVSKGGQGAKTSILYFEKGGPTDFVWHYRVENDGYSMGVNRKPIEGCQFPEIIDVFHKYIRRDKIPAPSANTFTIPSEWIKTLDPRVKERIRRETRTALENRSKKKREDLLKQLDEKIFKGKIDQTEYRGKLKQFDDTLENQIRNEIAKNIEKAHMYSFNLQNYLSDLTDRQIAEWKKVFSDIKPYNDGPLDQRYDILQTADPALAVRILASFDPRYVLHVDMAREYLRKNDNPDEALKRLRKILKKSSLYTRIKLSDVLSPKFNKIRKEDYSRDIVIIEKISFSDGKIHFRQIKETGMDLYFAQVDDLVTSKINVHQGALAIAPSNLVCSTHYQVYAINKMKVLPEYICYILRSSNFLNELIKEKNDGIKNEQGPDFFLNFRIPLPPLNIQKSIIEYINQQNNILQSVRNIEKNFDIFIQSRGDEELHHIGDAVIETRNGWSPQCSGSGEIAVLTLSCLSNGVIDFSKKKITDAYRPDIAKFFVREGDFFYSRGNTKELVALAAVAEQVPKNVIFPDLLTRVKFDQNKILPKYAVSLFNSKIGRDYFGATPVGGTPNMVKVSQEYMMNFMVPLMGNIMEQENIVRQIEAGRKAVKALEYLKAIADDRIRCLSQKIWGEKTEENGNP
jgi:type I restriction-modification system DNA methylase subunit/restriction endonuclease S subunit